MKKVITIFALVGFLSACNLGGGGSKRSSTSSSSNTARVEFETRCGAVSDGSLSNPVSASLLVDVVRVISSNLIQVRESGATTGDFLVKLHALGLSQYGESSATSALESLSTSPVYYVPAKDGCVVDVPGGQAFTGQLFTSTGQSFSEELILSGYSGEAESSGACSEELLTSCYAPLIEENAIKSAGQITDFLWKPRAESGYNHGMPVIHANPCNATVYVNGQALRDFGPGNGRCNTSRMFSGCGSYGSNIKVEVIDNKTGLPYFNGDVPYVTVPNGCSRYEFKR